MRLLVVGAGATGGYFGGRLAAAGRDVTFLVRPARADILRGGGLSVTSPRGNIAITPGVVTAAQVAGPFDAVLLAVKAYSLESVLQDMAPAIGTDTMILPVLNGMRHMDILAKRFGKQTLLGCTCKISTILGEDGGIIHLSPMHELSYGELDGNTSARASHLHEFMHGAGFDARLSSTIEREMWEKWVLLATLGAANCLMRGDIGAISASAYGHETTRRLLDEASSVANKSATPPSEAFLDHARAMLTKSGSPMTSSMYRDLARGGPVEADAIIGDMVGRARDASIEVPLLTAAMAQLRVFEIGRARGFV